MEEEIMEKKRRCGVKKGTMIEKIWRRKMKQGKMEMKEETNEGKIIRRKKETEEKNVKKVKQRREEKRERKVGGRK